ncbi:VanZ family protein [bacterium]|nr:VanZ family protein [bacterium]
MLQFIKKHKFTIAFLSFTLLIWILSSIPRYHIPEGLRINDKVIHIFEFALLGLLGSLAYNEIWKNEKYCINAVTTFIVCSAYGGVDELHQYFIIGRNSSFGDFIADSIGVLIGLGIAYFIRSKKKDQPDAP